MAQGNPQAVAILLNCLLIQEYENINKKSKYPRTSVGSQGGRSPGGRQERGCHGAEQEGRSSSGSNRGIVPDPRRAEG